MFKNLVSLLSRHASYVPSFRRDLLPSRAILKLKVAGLDGKEVLIFDSSKRPPPLYKCDRWCAKDGFCVHFSRCWGLYSELVCVSGGVCTALGLFAKCWAYSCVLKNLTEIRTYWFKNIQSVVTICTFMFNIEQFCVLPTLYLCVLCGSQNKQRLFRYTALTDWFV
jgi:hypothetical protein